MRFVCACFCIATISHWHPLLEPLPKLIGIRLCAKTTATSTRSDSMTLTAGFVP